MDFFSIVRNQRNFYLWQKNFNRQKSFLDRNITFVFGPDIPSLGKSDLGVILLVRNGENQIGSFLKHHFSIGASHILVLDNNSSDDTVRIAKRYPKATIYSTKLPFKSYQHFLRAWAGYHIGGEGWVLCVDIDERFDYPGSSKITIQYLLDYLNVRKFSAVKAHMLDLFSLKPSSSWPASGESLESECIWYDLSDITWSNNKNQYKRNAFGGIRLTSFGTMPLLSKHPLLNWRLGARPSLKDAHNLSCGSLADFTTILKHYKFHHSFKEHCSNAITEGNYWCNSEEYRKYFEVVGGKTDFCFNPKNHQQFISVDHLITKQFVLISDRYKRLIEL